MKHKTPDLNIIIVTYNSYFWLEKTLRSLQNFYLNKTKRRVVVTVIDNNSQDETTTSLPKAFEFVNLIKLSQNHGFAVANNIGIQATKAKFYLLLNSDTELTESSNLDTLINFASAKPKVGILTPKLELSSGQIDWACHRGEPTLLASLFYFLKLDKLLPNSRSFGQYHLTYKDLNTTHTIDACSGASLLIKNSVIERIGLLDEQFFMYAEDLDWCKRARDAGYLIVYHPGGKIIHHKYKSGIKNSSQKIAKKTQVHFYETMLQYYDKHYAQHYPRVLRAVLKTIINIKKGGL